jgi:hypothetical protein
MRSTLGAMTMSDDFFAPAPFRSAEGLATLRRSLRELGLVERGGCFELRGQSVVQLALEGDATIRAQLAKRPAASPDRETRLLCSHADLRRFTDELRRRLARWSDHDD